MDYRIILGLDISTECTGVSVVYVDGEGNIKPIVVTHLRHKIQKGITGVQALFTKCDMFMKALEGILRSNNLYETDVTGMTTSHITDIVIEEPLISSNNKYTVATLLRYNGMIAYKVFSLLGIVPVFISSADARKFGVPTLMAIRKFNKKGECYANTKINNSLNKNELVLFGAYPFDCAKKLILWNYVSEKFPNIQWVYNKKGELSKENFDASDSLICVLGLLNYEKYNETKPVITEYSETDEGWQYTFTFCGETFTKFIEKH